MKKTAYIAPAVKVTVVKLQLLGNGSITSIGGNSGLLMGTEETPGSADSRRSNSLWDDDDEW